MGSKNTPERKKFRVAVSGSTIDGREISGEMLRQAAENYDPSVYASRVNIEHV
ncbi:GPO family capsid scaffolding protein, partial [Escherichia coli]|nr:GPO family capsid scaffolding protein [Escherichia coli]